MFVPTDIMNEYTRTVTATTLHPSVPIHDDVAEGLATLVGGVPAGAVVVRGLAVGDVPATPAVMVAPEGGSVSEQSLLDAARRLGTPIGYLQEHGGQVVQNIFPLASSVGEQISTSSDVPLAFHTETAFHPHKSDYLLLLCLRGDPAAATTLCSWDAIEPQLSASARRTLAEPRFRIGVDASFGCDDGWMSPPAPVVARQADGSAEFTYDGELAVGLDAGATSALDELSAIIASTHTAVILEEGDLLAVDNARAVHGRSMFHARFDGSDRWLRRTFVRRSLAGVIDRRGDVITTEFRRSA